MKILNKEKYLICNLGWSENPYSYNIFRVDNTAKKAVRKEEVRVIEKIYFCLHLLKLIGSRSKSGEKAASRSKKYE